MTRVWKITLFIALLTACFIAEEARAQISVQAYSPTVYNANTALMDEVLGTTGMRVEDFEDTTLASGLSYSLTAPELGTFTSLPRAYDISEWDATANNQWDGTHVLASTSDNRHTGPRANKVTFSVAGGTRSFGVGLSNFQSLSSPSNQFPVTDHHLFVNGVNLGRLETIAAPAWVPGRTRRNVYLRFNASGSDLIHSVAFANVDQVGTIDFLAFDHVTFRPSEEGPASAVPEPASVLLLFPGLAVCCLLRRRR